MILWRRKPHQLAGKAEEGTMGLPNQQATESIDIQTITEQGFRNQKTMQVMSIVYYNKDPYDHNARKP